MGNKLTQKSLVELQQINKSMARVFTDFCESNNLLCYLCGGGCIGAVRHEGFIPWDDDLDFFMPRKDYEKLKDIWKDNDEYTLWFPERQPRDNNAFMTMRNNNTTFIKTYQKDLDIHHGVAIDIFPLDARPKGISRLLQVFWALVYQLFCSETVPVNYGRVIHFFGKTLLRLIKGEHRHKIWKFAEKQMSKYDYSDTEYLTELCAGPKYMLKKYPKTIFEAAIYKKFEDEKLPVPIGFDEYLKIAFGNYNVLPPVELRFPSHDFVFMDLHQKYTEYKGKYYMVKRSSIDDKN